MIISFRIGSLLPTTLDVSIKQQFRDKNWAYDVGAKFCCAERASGAGLTRETGNLLALISLTAWSARPGLNASEDSILLPAASRSRPANESSVLIPLRGGKCRGGKIEDDKIVSSDKEQLMSHARFLTLTLLPPLFGLTTGVCFCIRSVHKGSFLT
jgi:hypothetical protein